MDWIFLIDGGLMNWSCGLGCICRGCNRGWRFFYWIFLDEVIRWIGVLDWEVKLMWKVKKRRLKRVFAIGRFGWMNWSSGLGYICRCNRRGWRGLYWVFVIIGSGWMNWSCGLGCICRRYNRWGCRGLYWVCGGSCWLLRYECCKIICSISDVFFYWWYVCY